MLILIDVQYLQKAVCSFEIVGIVKFTPSQVPIAQWGNPPTPYHNLENTYWVLGINTYECEFYLSNGFWLIITFSISHFRAYYVWFFYQFTVLKSKGYILVPDGARKMGFSKIQFIYLIMVLILFPSFLHFSNWDFFHARLNSHYKKKKHKKIK